MVDCTSDKDMRDVLRGTEETPTMRGNVLCRVLDGLSSFIFPISLTVAELYVWLFSFTAYTVRLLVWLVCWSKAEFGPHLCFYHFKWLARIKWLSLGFGGLAWHVPFANLFICLFHLSVCSTVCWFVCLGEKGNTQASGENMTFSEIAFSQLSIFIAFHSAFV